MYVCKCSADGFMPMRFAFFSAHVCKVFVPETNERGQVI